MCHLKKLNIGYIIIYTNTLSIPIPIAMTTPLFVVNNPGPNDFQENWIFGIFDSYEKAISSMKSDFKKNHVHYGLDESEPAMYYKIVSSVFKLNEPCDEENVDVFGTHHKGDIVDNVAYYRFFIKNNEVVYEKADNFDIIEENDDIIEENDFKNQL
jgi:hypothetical protein